MKFKEEYVKQVKKLCKLGMIDKEIAEFFDVALSTLHKWKLEYPDFYFSMQEGRNFADANVAQALYRRAMGYSHKAKKFFNNNGVVIEQEYTEHYPPDTTACIFWLCNRQPQLWKRNKPDNPEEIDITPSKVVFEVTDARKR